MRVRVRVILVLLSWFCMWSKGQLSDYKGWGHQAALSGGLCRYGNSVECCWGWRQAERGRCQPYCQQGCKHGDCVAPDRCKCRPGYTGKACNQDLNECGLKPRPCKHRCMNTPGSYKCYCLDGYTLQPDGSCRNARTCYHANCQYGCEVIKGAVRCTCPSPGLRLGPDKRTCLDIDECVSGAGVCPRRRKCTNTFGSFVCKCHLGFKLLYINGRYTCVDKDTRPFCSLNPSSPKCRCRDGSCKAPPNVALEPQRPRTMPTTTTITTFTTPPTTTTTTTTAPPTTTTTTSPPPTTTTTTAPPPTTSTTTAPPPTTTITTGPPPTTTTTTSPPPTKTTTTAPSPITTTTTSPPPTTTTSTAPPPTTTTTTAPPPTKTTSSAPPTTTPTTTLVAATLKPTVPISITTAADTTLLPATTTTAPPTTAATTTMMIEAATTTTKAPTPTLNTTITLLAATTYTTTPPTITTSMTLPTTTEMDTTTPTPPTPPPSTTTTTTVAPTTAMLTTFALVTTSTNNKVKLRGDVHIPRHANDNHVWEFDIELGNTADYAKDDPEVGLLRCTFDHGACDWMSDGEGDLHWETTQNPAGGWYLSVPQLKAGQKSVRGARLAVQIVPSWSRNVCFSFSHWLTGHHVGVLQLFVRAKGRNQRYSTALWSRTGGHGWRHTQVTLTTYSVDRVLLKAERRQGPQGLIAIDDVTLRQGACR